VTADLAQQYGPDKPCRRTACADGDPHLGGAHIDPRNPLYDGPTTTVNALPMTARDACRNLLAGGASVPDVVDLAREIHRLRDQVAAVRVDMDRQVRAAIQRAGDCEEHGKDIRRLEEQVHHFDRAADKNDAGRLALLSGFHALEDGIGILEEKIRRGEEVPDLGTVLNVFAKAIDRTYAAHKRAWSK
jgi:outer membrane murein-binding lipoprotein Lpp